MYDKAKFTRHVFDITCDGSTAQRHIKGPKGKNGRPYNYGVEGVTTTLTSAATIAIGTVADPDLYGEEFSVAGVTEAANVRNSYYPVEAAGYSTTDLSDVIVGESTWGSTAAIVMTVVTSSDGAGTFFVEMEWND